ncbi:MAG: hypothetical protein KKB25_03740, partial [Nanoarchaeota archaeon]|nr:hypothetical protein [Nanoarchaeota archaeon]
MGNKKRESEKKESENKEGGAGTGEPVAEENGKTPEKKAGGRNGIKIAVSLIIVIAIIVGLYFFLMSQPVKNPYQLKFANETLNFRANLEKAAAVPVIPDGSSVRSAILSDNVSKISLSYVPDEKYNGFYAVDGFEISYKLLIIMKHYYGINGYVYAGENGENCMFFEATAKTICISHAPVSSESDIVSSNSEPVIFMSASNETSVTLKNNTIYLKGTPAYVQDSGNKYTGLDMAT